MARSRTLVVNVDCNHDYLYERSRIEALGADLALHPPRTKVAIINACREAEIVLVESLGTPVTAQMRTRREG
jgi:hypothetical protein